MIINETKIGGCFVIDREFYKDERGYFSRAMCKKTLEKYGIKADFVQSNLSYNETKYTLRGLHSQQEPFGEDKLVMCTRGRILDVCVDVRKNSPTYKMYHAEVLSEENGKCLYIPAGCAHGYLSLEDDTQTLYYVTCEYTPDSEVCYRFDDPAFNIDWTVEHNLLKVSEKDRKHKLIGEKL